MKQIDIIKRAIADIEKIDSQGEYAGICNDLRDVAGIDGILNTTLHKGTPDQIESGLVEPTKEMARHFADNGNFTGLPTQRDIRARAQNIASLVRNNTPYRRAMIGGAAFFMEPLAQELRAMGIVPVYAFTKRELTEKPQPDGSVKKTHVFKHEGWVEA